MVEGESIDFAAKYKNWVAIKRMLIYEDTKPEEVAFHLAGIRESMDRKAFEILGIDTQSLDSFLEGALKGIKKSTTSFGIIGEVVSSPDAKAAAEKACAAKPELKKVATVYMIRKAARSLNLDFDVNQEMLASVYKDLKVKKPPGRQKKA